MQWTVSFLLCFVAFVHSAPQQAGVATNNKCTNEDGTSGECVPHNLCSSNNSIITDGFGLIDNRGFLNIKAAKSKSKSKDHRTTRTSCAGSSEECCGTSGVTEEKKKTNPPVPATVVSATTTTNTKGGCGIRNPDGIIFRIAVDDDEAQYDEFPWMVAVMKEQYEKSIRFTLNVYACGGSLIHPKVVLTAAQCVLPPAGSAALTLKVRAGEWDTQSKDEISPYQDRKVAKIISHDDYYSGALHNDIALLILETPVDDADNIGMVCLPPANIAPPSAKCFASGWGRDTFGDTGLFRFKLKKIELPIVERRKCQTELRKTSLGKWFQLHKSFTCAGGELKKDMCQGDGGSPLVCPMPNDPNRFMQVGIVSWGVRCGGSVPGVYGNVGYFRKWIDEQLIKENIDMTPYTA